MEEKKGLKVVERLKAYAKDHGISMAQMERAIGKTSAYLIQVKNPTAEVLIAACEAYPDMSPEWLLLGRETPQPDETDLEKIEYLKNQLMLAKMENEELKMQIHLLKKRLNA